jgi:hypothetical protein
MEQYISKAAVLAEINRGLNSYDPNEITSGRYALVELRDFINTLEVKDVDIEKEIKEQTYAYYNMCEEKLKEMSDDDTDLSFLTLDGYARYFFELGLNAKKGE